MPNIRTMNNRRRITRVREAARSDQEQMKATFMAICDMDSFVIHPAGSPPTRPVGAYRPTPDRKHPYNPRARVIIRGMDR